jgi:hypothetical protein
MVDLQSKEIFHRDLKAESNDFEPVIALFHFARLGHGCGRHTIGVDKDQESGKLSDDDAFAVLR